MMAGSRSAHGGHVADGSVGGLVERFRRAPLMVKVGGASMPLVATVLLVTWWNVREDGLPPYALSLVLVVVIATVVAHLALVAFAWQPIDRVGMAIESFAGGEEATTVTASEWSDRDVLRLERNVDRLLATVRRERQRGRLLAGRVLRHADDEQGLIARELFDSTAQSMAALLLELRALSAGVGDRALLDRLDGVRQIASGVLEDVKALSQEANPRWQAQEGLEGAIEHLIREHNAHTEARLSYELAAAVEAVDPATASLVYRTVRAALRYAAQERCPGLELTVRRVGDRVVLDVVDASERAALQGGSNPPETIDVLRARAELLGGTLDLQRVGDRRRLHLEVPMAPQASSDPSLQESQ